MYPNQTSKSFAAFFMASAKVSHADWRENTLLYHWGRFRLVLFLANEICLFCAVLKNSTKRNRPQWYHFLYFTAASSIGRHFL